MQPSSISLESVLAACDFAALSGYQWKNIFLHQGTLLRTVFNGKNFYTLVEGDQIRYENAVSTPSRFANAVGGVRRNAWKVVWVLFPNTTTWKLAEELRPRRKPTGSRHPKGRASFTGRLPGRQ